MRTIEEVLAYVEKRVADFKTAGARTGYGSTACATLEQLGDFILSPGEDPHPWGPEPSAEEATAHAARPGRSMGLWLRRDRPSRGPLGLEVVQTKVNEMHCGQSAVEFYPRPTWCSPDREYRPINDEGALVLRPTRTT